REAWREMPRVTLVTRGVQAVGAANGAVSVAQAPLWGFGRTIAREHSAFWGGLIDLDPAATAEASADHLTAGLLARDGEDQVAWRSGVRHVARLVRRSAAPAALPLRWRSDGTYLITGGLGGLGLLVARWMVEQGARRLILLARTRVPPRARWGEVD